MLIILLLSRFRHNVRLFHAFISFLQRAIYCCCCYADISPLPPRQRHYAMLPFTMPLFISALLMPRCCAMLYDAAMPCYAASCADRCACHMRAISAPQQPCRVRCQRVHMRRHIDVIWCWLPPDAVYWLTYERILFEEDYIRFFIQYLMFFALRLIISASLLSPHATLSFIFFFVICSPPLMFITTLIYAAMLLMLPAPLMLFTDDAFDIFSPLPWWYSTCCFLIDLIIFICFISLSDMVFARHFRCHFRRWFSLPLPAAFRARCLFSALCRRFSSWLLMLRFLLHMPRFSSLDAPCFSADYAVTMLLAAYARYGDDLYIIIL